MPREQSIPRRAPQNVGDRRPAATASNPLQTPPPRSSSSGAAQQDSNKKAAAQALATPRKDLHGDSLEYTLPSGARYVGSFEHGLMHGTGRYQYANGDVYEGDFRNDKIHGHGTYVYESGDEYTGEWQKGHRNGKGSYTFGHNGSVLVGWWRADQPHGFGRLLMPDQEEPRYEGNWEESMRHGLGVQRHPNSSSYDGYWDRGREDGMGVLTGADGSIYCGEWRAGQRDGRGIIIEHGVKYVVEFNFDYQTSRKQLPKDGPVPSDFKPVYDYFLKWWKKNRTNREGTGAGAGEVTALVVDRELYENVLHERDALEKALAELAEQSGGGADDANEEDMLAASNNPAELKRSIRQLIHQRNVERHRAVIAEQKVGRLRMAGVDVDGAMAAEGGAAASGKGGARSTSTNGRPATSPSPVNGALQEQMQAMESELKVKETKLREAEKRNIAAQNSIDNLQGEINAARMKEAAASSNNNNGGTNSAMGNRAGGHRPSMTPKAVDSDENTRLNFELARLKKELDEAVRGKDDAEKKYGKEKEKHKRASRERDAAKANLMVREQEAALNERLFRLIGAGQALMLGVVAPGGALNVGEDAKSVSCATPDVTFELDAVYRTDQMQELEDEWVNAVTGVRNGYSCAMLMLGSDEGARGSLVSSVLPAVVKQLFGATTQMQGLYDVTISMSFVEVARHNVTDLLSQQESASGITIMKDARGTIAFEGATRLPVTSADEAVETWSRTMDQLQRRVSNKLLFFWVDAVDKASKATFHGKLLMGDICATTASNAPLVATESCNLLLNALTEFSNTDTYQHRGEPLLMALNDAIGGPTRTIFMFGAGPERTLSGSTQTMLQTLSDCREKISNFPLQHFETPHALALERYVAEKAPRELPPRFFPLAQQK